MFTGSFSVLLIDRYNSKGVKPTLKRFYSFHMISAHRSKEERCTPAFDDWQRLPERSQFAGLSQKKTKCFDQPCAFLLYTASSPLPNRLRLIFRVWLLDASGRVYLSNLARIRQAVFSCAPQIDFTFVSVNTTISPHELLIRRNTMFCTFRNN